MNRTRLFLLSAAAAAAAGCAGMRAQQARASYLRDAMGSTTFPGACLDIWPQVLRTLAAQGLELVGRDREIAGQPEQGAVARFFSRGFQTTQAEGGVLETGTDANRDLLRMVVRGAPAGENGCRIQVTAYQGDLAQNPEREWRDYDVELAVLARVAPEQADRIERGAEAAAR
jgi:hypothetical protein